MPACLQESEFPCWRWQEYDKAFACVRPHPPPPHKSLTPTLMRLHLDKPALFSSCGVPRAAVRVLRAFAAAAWTLKASSTPAGMAGHRDCRDWHKVQQASPAQHHHQEGMTAMACHCHWSWGWMASFDPPTYSNAVQYLPTAFYGHVCVVRKPVALQKGLAISHSSVDHGGALFSHMICPTGHRDW